LGNQREMPGGSQKGGNESSFLIQNFWRKVKKETQAKKNGVGGATGGERTN